MTLAARLEDHHFRVVFLSLLITMKVIFAGLTPFSLDFLNWVSLGAEVLSGRRFFGIYTAPAYIYAPMYFLWLRVTNDSTALIRTYLSFSFFDQGPRMVAFTAEMFAFTLFMKIPLLLADLSTLLVLMHIIKRITSSSTKSLTAALLWASSPLVLLAEMANTVDIFPALLILAGVYAIYLSKIKLGSGLLAFGWILRLAPLLFIWIYLVAFARLRQFKNIVSFLSIQLAFFAVGILYVVYFAGTNAVFQLLGARPGILVDEILSSLGLFVLPGIGYNPYGVGLNITAYILLAYFLTKPSNWNQRKLGVEALVFLGAYFALTSYFPHFLLWMLPIYVVYTVTTSFGSARFLLSTLLGLAFMVVQESRNFFGNEKAVFFIPNMNAAMASASSTLSPLYSLTLVPNFVHSTFSASLLLLLFWILTERRRRARSLSSSVNAMELKRN